MKKQFEEVNQKLDAQAKEIAELKSMVRQLLNPKIDTRSLLDAMHQYQKTAQLYNKEHGRNKADMFLPPVTIDSKMAC